MIRFNVWCSLDERGPLRVRPNWTGTAVSPANAAIEAAKQFTRNDPGLTPLFCRVETAPEADKPVARMYKVEAVPTVQWKASRSE